MRVVPYLAIATLAVSTSAAASLFQPRGAGSSSSSGGATCANVNADLIVYSKDFGPISRCLCTDNLNPSLDSDKAAQDAVILYGAPAVSAALISLIQSSSDQVNSCSYNIGIVLPGPATRPSSRKRSPEDIARSEHRCEFGLTKCGIYSSWSHEKAPTTTSYNSPGKGLVQPYECVDTQTNLESCGGCVVPYTLGLTKDELKNTKLGVDCTGLRGVGDVGCHKGKCIVRKCRKGYELAAIIGEVDVLECLPVKKSGGDEGELHEQVGGTLVWKKDLEK